MLLGILLRVGHEQIAIDVLQPKRRETGRDRRVLEIAVRGDGNIVVIEDVDRSGAKIGCEEKHTVRVGAKHQRLVHRGRRRIVDRKHRFVAGRPLIKMRALYILANHE